MPFRPPSSIDSAPGAAAAAGFRPGFVVWALVLCSVCLSGCMTVQVGVTNPVRGLNTVAVVPFFNQSSERAVDGRQMALLYAAELQKIPGVEVIPVGAVETAMRDYQLEDVDGPEVAVRLAAVLNADAVVVGTITEYSPYYPPRIGMSVAWYSPYGLQFDPGVSVDDDARRRIHRDLRERRKAKVDFHKQRFIGGVERRLDDFFLFEPGLHELGPCDADDCEPSCDPASGAPSGGGTNDVQPAGPKLQRPDQGGGRGGSLPSPAPDRFRQPVIVRSQSPGREPLLLEPFPPQLPAPATSGVRTAAPPALLARRTTPKAAAPPIRPLMTYTKMLDAADSATAAAYRDFVELRGDERGGNWVARLQWADEFPRFAAHTMIVEMFQLHGGQGRRRVILKWRKHQ